MTRSNSITRCEPMSRKGLRSIFPTLHILNFILPDGIVVESMGGYRAGGLTGPSSVPEPSSLLLLGSGLAGVAGITWKWQRPS